MSRRAPRAILFALPLALGTAACIRSPSPLTPRSAGSIGLPHRGTLSSPARLPESGPGFTRLRRDARSYGTPRLVGAIRRAASSVATDRPGSVLVVGDLSVAHGGKLLPHLSHRTGRDADLLLYVDTPEGARVTSPGFVHFGADGLAWDPTHRRFLRFDVEREWLLIRSLVEDDDARVQWIFLNHALVPMLIEWARARGEPAATIRRAEAVLLEPKPGGVHDDHTHVRVACSDEEVVQGCEPNGPDRAWFLRTDEPSTPPPSTEQLVHELTASVAELEARNSP